MWSATIVNRSVRDGKINDDEKMREMPLFPLVPILPFAVMVAVVSFSVLNYCAVKRVEEKLKQIYPSKSS